MTLPNLSVLAAWGACLMLASTAAAHETPLPGPRPFEEMKGPCANFAMNIDRELEAWKTDAPQAVTASATPDDAPVLTDGTVARIDLVPHPQVIFDTPPQQDRGAPEKFSGHVVVNVPQAGLWRVAASNGLWFDAVVAGDIVPSAAFEMQTQCASPFKVVVFDLPAGQVHLQFNGSPTPQVEVLVLPWAHP